ncbi:UPF0237 protein BL1209.1 [Clostridia bacterium]|nr:UPF0237 protein BL1209.1 [Clostridia bacterium]
MEQKTDRVIITVLGKDTVGIIAKVCTYLAQKKINVLDISQTIVQDFFQMMMIVDQTNSLVSFEEYVGALEALGEEIGVVIKCQREAIFEQMHRI